MRCTGNSTDSSIFKLLRKKSSKVRMERTDPLDPKWGFHIFLSTSIFKGEPKDSYGSGSKMYSLGPGFGALKVPVQYSCCQNPEANARHGLGG